MAESVLLATTIATVPSFGDPEPSFIGGGRVGAGGQPDGAWDFLIGPTYSSPNFLHEERLSVGWRGGRNRAVAPAMYRAAGSGLLCGRQRVGDLEIEVWEVAPWGGQEVLRIVAVVSRGAGVVAGLRVQAFVRAPGKPAILDQELRIALPLGTPSYGGECPSWEDRCARIAWNRPAALCVDYRDNVGAGYLLTCELGDLPPGGRVTAALIHRVEAGPTSDSGNLAVEPAALVERELQGWRAWFDRAVPAVGQDPLIESQLAFIRMQQSYDGGFIAGVRRYAYSYIRDMHGACRGLMAAGFLDEASRALAWIDRKARRFGTVVNASEMGADVRDFVGGHKGTELPAYYLFLAVGLLRRGHDGAAIDACRETLVQAADEQIAVSRSDGWRFRYNGDETERYVPVVDGANYLFNKPDWSKERALWSMPSHVLAMASVTAFACDLAPRWGLDPAPYLAAVESWRASFAPTFQPDGRAVPAWTVFPDGSLPAYPVPNYLLFAAWTDAPFPAADVRACVEAAESCLDPARGRVPVSPGAVEGTCGHDLALLLYGLKRIGAAPERVARVEKLVRQSGSLQWFGMVNEFYGPNGTPNQHNLRPFETGPLIEALIKGGAGERGAWRVARDA